MDNTIWKLKIQSVSNPHKLEVIWGLASLVKPSPGQISNKLLVCSIYSPPKSRNKANLIEHLIANVNHFMSKFKNLTVILAGDTNCLKLAPVIDALNGFVQINRARTLGQAVIDVIITNRPTLYQLPVSVEPVVVDNPGDGVPSDHKMLLCQPIDKEAEGQSIWKFPDDKIKMFSQKMSKVDWNFLHSLDVNSKVGMLNKWQEVFVDIYFPTADIKFSNFDQP